MALLSTASGELSPLTAARGSLSARDEAESVSHEKPPAEVGTFTPVSPRAQRLNGDKFQFTSSSVSKCEPSFGNCGLSDVSEKQGVDIADTLEDKVSGRFFTFRTGRDGGGGNSEMSGNLRITGAAAGSSTLRAGGCGGFAPTACTFLSSSFVAASSSSGDEVLPLSGLQTR